MGVDRLQLLGRPTGPTWLSGQLTSLEGNVAMGDVQLLDPEGRVLLKVSGVRLRRVPRDWLKRLVAGPLPDWRMSWPGRPNRWRRPPNRPPPRRPPRPPAAG